MSYFDEPATPRMRTTSIQHGDAPFPCPYCGHGRSSETADCGNCGWQAPRSARAERRETRTERREERAAKLAASKAKFVEDFNESMADQTTGRFVTGLLLTPYTIYRWKKVRDAQKRSYWAIRHSRQDFEELGRMTLLRTCVAPVVTQIIKAVRAGRK